MDSILDFIRKQTDEKGPVFCVNYENSFEIKKDNFHTLELSKDPVLVYAVDGGSATIHDNGAWAIHKIRISYVKFKEKTLEESSKDYYLAVVNKRESLFKLDPEEIKPSVKKQEDALTVYRKNLELKKIYDLLSVAEEGSFIIKDGSLRDDYDLALELFKKAKERKIILVGFSKTSRLRTNKGRPLIGYLSSIAPQGSWYYYPIFDDYFGIKTVVAKLHPKSDLAYRIDVFGGDLPYVLSKLSFLARDLSLLGYPYPLVKVDKIARIGEDEVKQEKEKLEMKGGDLYKLDKIASETHELLDERAYKK